MVYAAGQPLAANDINMVTQSNTDPTARTTASTAYTTTLTAANICGTSFIVPPSGIVLILWSCEQLVTGGTLSYTSFAIREGSTVGSGTSFLASSDDRMVGNNSSTSLRMGTSHRVTGLTPGSVYNVALEHRVASGTGTFARRSVDVIPQLA